MAEFDVSRTVVREALSQLQASGLVRRATASAPSARRRRPPGFRIRPDHFDTLQDVVAVLELRIGLETEAAALAAQRRSEANLTAMRLALDALARRWSKARRRRPDFQFTRRSRAPRRTPTSPTDDHAGQPHHPARPAGPQTRRRRTRAATTCGASTPSTRASTTRSPRRTPKAPRAAMRTHLANGRERRRRRAQLAQQLSARRRRTMTVDRQHAARLDVRSRVVPVAGHDSMLLNLSGAHGPFFTRNIVHPRRSRRPHRRRRGAGRRDDPPARWKMPTRSSSGSPSAPCTRC